MNSRMQVCVIGAGPRGLSVLERICARERRRASCGELVVHLVDPEAPGPGRVWRTDQPRHLLMNTVASQITLYTDDSVEIEGPIEPGPTLYDWARELGSGAGDGRCDDETLAEARGLGPDSYPTRAFYGRYLQDVFQRLVDGAPRHVTVQVHTSRAVAMADTYGVTGGPQGVRLENGTRLNNLSAIVMAQGHLPSHPSPREARTASLARIHHLTYIPPGNPADHDLSEVKPGENVLLRGLGLNFFDYMTLFTAGRGGRYETRDGRLLYHPSGEEPRMFAASRRGIPYQARGENQKGPYGRYTPRLLTPQVIEELRERHRAGRLLRFSTDLWPLIAREVESAYYGTLLRSRGRGAEAEDFIARYLAAGGLMDLSGLLDDFGIEPDDHWDWDRLARPCGNRTFGGSEEFHQWLLDYLRRDVREARAGNVDGPLKAALDVLRDLRNEIRLLVDHGGVDGSSYRDDVVQWYTPLNAFLSIGPPASRIQEMVALIEAGVLRLIGPGTGIRIATTDPAFLAKSPVVDAEPVRATVLIEARMGEPDLLRTADPLLRHLLETEQCAPYSIPTANGRVYQTGGMAVTERPYHVIDADGHAQPRRFAYGVPTESVHWVTAAGIRPGVNSVTLGDSDAIAAAVLALPEATTLPAAVHAQAEEMYVRGVAV
ncbi:FAD/NAD(P)-binding protein [Streptomyces sp.]|uniref:FAD/NAD(P)-binding protein n=1 Tax=Streptomyces sp. TaxID=1931 RepID=UPI002F4229F7